MFGYKGTTMDQVAKLAGVAKGTIYTFFKTKEELFNEIIENLINVMKERAEKAIHSQDSFFDNLHRALFEVLEFRKEHHLTLKLSQEVREIGTEKAKGALDWFEAEILLFIERYLQSAIAKGKIVPCDPRKTAFVMLHLYIALVFDWEENEEPLSSQEVAELLERYLVFGLKPRVGE
nr:TetR/AcrR family transcriptional regulator [Pullulanibacillus pueri]